MGCDRSEGLLQICRDRQYQVFLSDCMNIAVPTNMFDGIICIAVLHHISTEVGVDLHFFEEKKVRIYFRIDE